MIETALIAYLNSNLECEAFMEIPENPPEEYVVLEKTGSSEKDYITMSTIAIQSTALTMLRALTINEAVKDAMEGVVGLPEISDCSLNSDYNYTDTTTKRYRYQSVYDITHRRGGKK